MTHPAGHENAASHWHTIRPWTSRLSLTIREITSVSATFVLCSDLDPPDSPIDLSSFGIDEHDVYDESQTPWNLSGRELAVKVNGTPWQNVLVEMIDDTEEAIIVLYGLMPGRHYEVELNVVSGKESIVRKTIVTEADSDGSPVSEHAPEFPEYTRTASSDSLAVPNIPGSHSPGHTSVPHSPPHPHQQAQPRTITVEERAAQLRHTLSLLNAEKEQLTQSLKNARKETQRSEAATRSEMEALKRASEKQSANETRTRQKVLALQESVKQVLHAAHEAEREAVEVEASMPALHADAELVESVHTTMSGDAKRSEAETEESIAGDKKRVNDLQAELQALTHRLDRLSSKKDRLEKESIPELEEQLFRLDAEREELEREEQLDLERYGALDDYSPTSNSDGGLPSSEPRNSHASSGSGGRLGPIGRPSHYAQTPPRASSPRPQHLHTHSSPSRPGILNVPHRQGTR